MVYARFSLSGTPLVWYVIEGQPEGEDYLFFGFVLGRNDCSATSGFQSWKPGRKPRWANKSSGIRISFPDGSLM